MKENYKNICITVNIKTEQ